MWRKLQGQSVRGVPALQQFHLCRESRAYRSPGHRCGTHLSEPGGHNLPHTQVSTVGISDYQHDHILLDLIKPPAVTCRKLKAKKQRQQSTPQQYWRVKPRAWSPFWFPCSLVAESHWPYWSQYCIRLGLINRGVQRQAAGWQFILIFHEFS